jgi:pimeloyl-ACP methyl ester carboxylesterase
LDLSVSVSPRQNTRQHAPKDRVDHHVCTTVMLLRCGYFLAVLVAVVATLVGFALWDTRDAALKADSILFVKQSFDERVDIPSTDGRPTRWFYVDRPAAVEGVGAHGLSENASSSNNSSHRSNNSSSRRPIIFFIHGKASNADDMKTLFGADAVAKARKRGFLVVYPVGVINSKASRTWNAGSVDAHNTEDDVAYFTQAVRLLEAHFDGDAQRVFVAGMSNGAFMTHRLACAWANHGSEKEEQEKSDGAVGRASLAPLPIRVRGIAATLGGMAHVRYDAECGGDALRIGGIPIPPIRAFDQQKCPYAQWRQAPSHFSCDDVRNLPVLLVNNGLDVLVPTGGAVVTGGANDEGELYPPLVYTRRFYAEANGCDYNDNANANANDKDNDNANDNDGDGKDKDKDNANINDGDGKVNLKDKDKDKDNDGDGKVNLKDKDKDKDNDGDGKVNLKDEDVTTCESLTGCRANTTICTSHRSGHNWVTPNNGDDPAMPSRFFRWLMSPYAKSFDTSAAILDFFLQHCT